MRPTDSIRRPGSTLSTSSGVQSRSMDGSSRSTAMKAAPSSGWGQLAPDSLDLR